jgi:hypothetical protein
MSAAGLWFELLLTSFLTQTPLLESIQLPARSAQDIQFSEQHVRKSRDVKVRWIEVERTKAKGQKRKHQEPGLLISARDSIILISIRIMMKGVVIVKCGKCRII